MDKKTVCVLSLAVMFMAAVVVASMFAFGQEKPYTDRTNVNEGVAGVQTFHVSSDSTNLNTSAEGAVFIKADGDTPTHAQIVATLEIDPDDWGGVAFYIPDKWYVSNIASSYPESDSASDLPHYVSTWTTAGEPSHGYRAMIEVGRDRTGNGRAAGGGTGMIVIDLVADGQAAARTDAFHIEVAVGSDYRNGARILGPDSVRIPLSLNPH